MTPHYRQSGFTLLEILIAVAIFALVSSATFGMLQQTIKASSVFDDSAAELVELQRAKRLMQQDFSQIIARSSRDEYGDSLPAVVTESLTWGTALELSRTGRANPLHKSRSDILRLRYIFDGEKLIRRTWRHIDRAPDAQYLDQIVLDNIKSWNIALLGETDWVDAWPTASAKTALPRAIEVKIGLENEQQFRWLFVVYPQL